MTRNHRAHDARASLALDVLRAVALAGVVALAGCDDGGSITPAPPVEEPVVEFLSGTEWLNPLPQGNPLFALAVVAPDHYFAAGSNGTVVERDGAVTRVHQISERAFIAAWAYDAQDVYVAGHEGAVYRYDGAQWIGMPPPAEERISGIHGTSPSNIWCVTYSGNVFHYDGASWTAATKLGSNCCNAVWSLADGRAFVADEGRIHLWDGASWSVVFEESAPSAVTDFWGSSATNLYAVGHNGKLIRFDGVAWQKTQLDSTLHLLRIDGFDANTIWITALDGRILHGSGVNWVVQDDQLGRLAFGIGALDARRAVTVNYRAGFATGSIDGWTEEWPGYRFPLVAITVSDGAPCAFGDLVSYLRVEGDGVRRVSMDAARVRDAWSADGSEIIVVGGNGRIQRGRGDRWTRDSSGTDADLDAVHGTSASDVWAVGDERAALHFDGTRWQRLPLPQELYAYSLRDVWAVAPNDVYFVSSGGIHFDGAAWSVIELPGADYPFITAVWARSSTEVYFVGGPGAIFVYDGNVATRMPTETRTTLRAIHGNARGDVCAVGDQIVLWFVGGAWVEAPVGIGEDLTAVWVDDDGFAYITGEYGAVVRVRAPGA
ncbi:MAG: WD40/YVTN/BNR-like repeat-containing protein [bacterium]